MADTAAQVAELKGKLAEVEGILGQLPEGAAERAALEPLRQQLTSAIESLEAMAQQAPASDALPTGEPDAATNGESAPPTEDVHETQGAPTVEEEEQAPPVAVGGIYDAPFSGSLYPAMVTSVGDGTAHIRFLGYGDEMEVTLDVLRPIEALNPPDPSTLRPGSKCLARYAEDRQWYPVVVRLVTEEGFRVHFPEYGNDEVVPLSYLSVPPADASAAEAGATASSAAVEGAAAAAAPGASATAAEAAEAAAEASLDAIAGVGAGGGGGGGDAAAEKKKADRKSFMAKVFDTNVASWEIMEVPEEFQVQETDTAEQRKRKLRVARAIERKNAAKERETQRLAKQNSWQKFQAKASKRKRPKGFMTTIGKGSMFSVPDAVDARVGVTKSGEGMTDFRDKKKFRLNV